MQMEEYERLKKKEWDRGSLIGGEKKNLSLISLPEKQSRGEDAGL